MAAEIAVVEKRKPQRPFTVRGHSGLNHFGGILNDEFIPRLMGRRGRQVYRQMSDNSPVIGAALTVIKHPILSTTLDVKPGGSNNADLQAAEFIDSVRDDMTMTWEEALQDILTMNVYGWSWVECNYKRRQGETTDELTTSKHTDGLIGLSGLALRPQNTLEDWAMKDGRLLGMMQEGKRTSAPVLIPKEKSLHFKTEHNAGNPEGKSPLRNAYVPWYFSSKIRGFEGVGIERDLTGIPSIGVPSELLDDESNMSPEAIAQRDAIRKAAANMKVDEQAYVMYPLEYDEHNNPLYKWELMSSPGTGRFDTGAVLGRYNLEMTLSFLADFIFLGHEKIGTQALANSKTTMFGLVVEAIYDSIIAVFNRQLIPPLLSLNGFNPDVLANPPQFQRGRVIAPTLGEIVDAIRALSAAGMPMFPDEVLENRVREMLSLPPIADEGGASDPDADNANRAAQAAGAPKQPDEPEVEEES